jgi:hypothetical protein
MLLPVGITIACACLAAAAPYKDANSRVNNLAAANAPRNAEEDCEKSPTQPVYPPKAGHSSSYHQSSLRLQPAAHWSQDTSHVGWLSPVDVGKKTSVYYCEDGNPGNICTCMTIVSCADYRYRSIKIILLGSHPLLLQNTRSDS